ncbi:thrombospondin type-1 domain-containing protein 4-like isoform X2 [Prorops nasuta]|uniref:thrombospondin type-1 domain-containing protein 4-like isoform X2 n=1 Tax=Prorops nasuta TaxID=863751 RepID=UPI0034CF2364
MDSSGRLSDDSWRILRSKPWKPRGSFATSGSMTIINLGLIFILIMLTVTDTSSNYLPDKYPIEVYHMLQERTQFGFGRDNRARGSWGAWSVWSECSRSCGTGIQSQARECVPFRALRRRSIISENSTSNARPICIGTNKRYHTCNTQECPTTTDFRAEQCVKYNNKSYKGQTYAWEPFLNAPNSCALNCRAVGQRFYATLESIVIDGTPCDGPNLRGHNAGISMDRAERWLCVAGQCKPVGCDGVVGSGVITDACGVCGGRGMGCRLYEGIFMEPMLPKGHHTVTTIPRGAMSLNISELRFSNNFLALRDSNGSYILNGPWSYSPSGTYKAAGTTLTYQRGDRNRVESIVATGPLNESLHFEIHSQEMNPGVLYKYMLPIKDGDAVLAPPLVAIGSVDRGNEIPDPGSSVPVTVAVPRTLPVAGGARENGRRQVDKQISLVTGSQQEDARRLEMKHPPTTVMAGDQPKSRNRKRKRRKFAWKITGLTSCSNDCGGGIQTSIVKCIRESNQMAVNERRCKNAEKPIGPPPIRCNDHPCDVRPARWRADDWSECSVSCGTGTRTRKLECVQELNAKLTMRVAAGACMQPPDLRTVEVCTKPACPNSIPELKQMPSSQEKAPKWDVGPWSSCSTTCGQGFRFRMVTCITSGSSCTFSDKPESRSYCENPPCNIGKHSPWLVSGWSEKCSAECGEGVQTRQVACLAGNDLFCSANSKPETERSCFDTRNCNKTSWFLGPWSSCSVSCGNGIQKRETICVSKIEKGFAIRPEEDCGVARPSQQQICSMNPCPPEWYTSDWSQCTISSGKALAIRTVRCLQDRTVAVDCSQTTKPIHQQTCNAQPSKKELMMHKTVKKVGEVADCVDKYPNCNLVVKTGLCRIRYYKHSCCKCRE